MRKKRNPKSNTPKNNKKSEQTIIKNTTFLWKFIQLMISVFIMFFLTVGLGKATADVLIYMNDAKQSKTALEWMTFWIIGIIGLTCWCLLWLWFKVSEKKCMDLLTNKE